MTKKIVLNIIATGKYTIYLDPLIKSVRNFFLTEQEIKIIVYSDRKDFTSNKEDYVTTINIDNEPWPNPTLKRFHYFLLAENLIKNSDFSFYVDVDSLFVNEVSLPLEDLSGIIPTLHPGYYGSVGTPERNPNSTAYISRDARNNYFCGGFFGGDSQSFLKMCHEIRRNIDLDLSNGIIARWHDESHLNHYLFNNPPKNILGNKFAIGEPEMEDNPRSPLVFLDKNHEELRTKSDN